MGFTPERQPRWGMPDILLGLIAILAGAVVFTIPALVIVGLDQIETGLEDLSSADVALIGAVGLAGQSLATVAFLLLIARLKGLGSLRDDFGFRFRWGRDLGIGIGAGLGVLLLSGILQSLVAAVLGGEPETNTGAILGEERAGAAQIALAVMAAVVAPVVEELFFRGLALRAIERRLGAVAGVIGSSVVFGLLHLQAGSAAGVGSLIITIGVFGVVFALLTRWQGRLGPAIVAHGTINTIGVVAYLATL
ncbi:MAG: CPBP family intramembrane metalloprotease [Acidimicrobiales bacterium]|jgi:hypothetical protein|nr:CPBP family intramembrane metalloprotease [Acidimicrobiales bacterium]